MNLSKKTILSLSIITVVVIAIAFNYRSFNNHNRYVDISSLVKKAYTSPGKYDFNMEKNFSKEVYDYSNIYGNKSLHKGQIKILLNLNEINQHKINSKIFVYMICSIEVRDTNGKIIMGSSDDPVVFTVTQTSGKLYIERAQGYENPDEVPKIYK